MRLHDKIETKISDVLDSLDEIRRAEPALFLYTRLQVGINKSNPENFWERLSYFLKKPLVAGWAIAIILIINIAVIMANRSTYKDQTDNLNNSYASEDFNINLTDLYDPETTEP